MATAKKAVKTVNDDGVVIEFTHGEPINLALSQLSDEMKVKLCVHGLSQKLGDSYAGATAEEARDICAGVAQDLLDGKWSSRVAGAGGRTTLLAQALALATGEVLEACVAKLAEMDDETKKSVRNHPHIKSAMATIKAQKAAEDAAAAQKAMEDAPALTL